MSFTGRIRLYLILTALLPAAAVIAVIYFRSIGEIKRSDRLSAVDALSKFERFDERFRDELRQTALNIVASEPIERAALLIRSNRATRADISSLSLEVDFAEILDSNFRVLASARRPGLLDERVIEIPKLKSVGNSVEGGTIEYDVDGAHPAYACLVPITNGLFLYSGKYLSGDYRSTVKELLGAEVSVEMPADDRSILANMTPRRLYKRQDSLIAVIAGGQTAGFFFVARFPEGMAKPVFLSLLKDSGLVAATAVLLALVLGFYVTSQAKREIENLVMAAARVAQGDFSTPVMAFQEGEFSQLADSFSDMMVRLKALQAKLAMAEKIAAWQAMGRKLAHEVKNPLTPISISIDDLRRSYTEGQPEFEKILHETTTTTKNEISRLTRLIDQFVGFARMSAPQIVDARPEDVTGPVTFLYRSFIDNRRLTISNHSQRNRWPVDPEQLRQVLINLIKNGFETGEDTAVVVDIIDTDNGVSISVEDTGPGFPDDILASGFQPYLSRKKGGSGLGLVISQRIVHDHGGTIELENCSKGGARVTVTLPFSHG